MLARIIGVRIRQWLAALDCGGYLEAKEFGYRFRDIRGICEYKGLFSKHYHSKSHVLFQTYSKNIVSMAPSKLNLKYYLK